MNKNNLTTKEMFAIFVEENNDYVNYDGESFPSSTLYTFNGTKSYCVDVYNNIKENALLFENGYITVTSNVTLYCYLYFDKNIFDIETDILVNDGSGYKSVDYVPYGYNYVSYDCSNNEAISYFNYNYETNKFKFTSGDKNKCNVYFEKMIPDIEINLFVNDIEVEELVDNLNYQLISHECVNELNEIVDAQVNFDSTKNTIKVTLEETAICKVYLEGVE